MTPDINQTLKRLMSDPDMPVDPEWVDKMAAEYPAFFFPAALSVRRGHKTLDKDRLDSLLASLAVHCPDRVAIADFTDISDAGWDNFYPRRQMPQESSTDLTIDTFISTYGHSSPKEDALLERLIFSPVPADYLSVADEPCAPDAPLTLPPELSGEAPVVPPVFTGLKQQTACPPPFTGLHRPSVPSVPDTVPEESPSTDNQQSSLADRPAGADRPATQAPAPSEDSSLMESLAQFFIKKERYERAYDIISELSLKFPEKSVYFAEQLRFLQKKILTQKLSQENKTKNQE